MAKDGSDTGQRDEVEEVDDVDGVDDVGPDDDEGAVAVEQEDGSRRVMPRELDLKVDLDKLKLGQTSVEVDNLDASLDLEVNVANFVTVRAAARATIGRVALEVDGADVEAHLGLDIQHVTRVIETAVGRLIENPELLQAVEKSLERGVGAASAGVAASSPEADALSDGIAAQVLSKVKGLTPGESDAKGRDDA